jgi:hypothetical protein
VQTIVELEGVNGEWFTLAGPQAGDKGVYLGTGVTGLHDPPVKVMYEEPGNWPGARFLNHRILRRDIVFGVEIMDDRCDSWASRDSEWRKAWAFDRDCKLYVTTEESGTRYLKLRLGESPDVSWFMDPNGLNINRCGMVAIAGDPFWYEDDVIHSAVTTKDTRNGSVEDLIISVRAADRGGLNPTDRHIFPVWTVPGATDSSSVTWTLPDYSFMDDGYDNRRLRLPGLIPGENCVIDTDPRMEQVVSESGSQVWARMNGVRFRHPVPPWTPARDFQISVSGTIPGQMVTLRLSRPWTRPWGME